MEKDPGSVLVSQRHLHYDTKPDEVAATLRRKPEALRRPLKLRRVKPRTAAHHASGAVFNSRLVRTIGRIFANELILTPLLHVPHHIMQPPRVRPVTADDINKRAAVVKRKRLHPLDETFPARRVLDVSVAFAAGFRIAPEVFRRSTGAHRVFPLGLGRQL